MNKTYIIAIVIILLLLGAFSCPRKNIKSTPSASQPHLREDPCFLYENTNRLQTVYMKLRQNLNRLSSKKNIRLSNECARVTYIPGTGDSRLYREVDQITNIILDKLNNMSGFYFRKVYYDNITEISDKFGNKNFRYNVYVEDPQECFDVRLLIDVVKLVDYKPKKPQAITCAETTTPSFPTYVIGYPQPEQLIPLPTEVVTTGLLVLGDKGINRWDITPIKYLYINKVKLYNTNNVIDANGQCLAEGVCGNWEGSIASSPFNGPTTPFQEPACVRNRWPRLDTEPRNVKAWPCVPESEYWNNLGIPSPPACNTQKSGVRDSTTQFPITAQFTNSLFELPRWSGPNSWLFNLARGDPATESASFT